MKTSLVGAKLSIWRVVVFGRSERSTWRRGVRPMISVMSLAIFGCCMLCIASEVTPPLLPAGKLFVTQTLSRQDVPPHFTTPPPSLPPGG